MWDLGTLKRLNDEAVRKHADHQDKMFRKGFDAGVNFVRNAEGLPVTVDRKLIQRFIKIGAKFWHTVTPEEKKEYEHLRYVLTASVVKAYAKTL